VMPFIDSDLTVTRYGDDHWRLESTLIYQGEKDKFIVPAGYITDFATVPRIVVWLIPRFGRYTPAAILHDWLLTDDPTISSRDKDGIFRRVLRELEVPFVMRWLMWTGVRWGALFNSDRREGWHRDAPVVLCVSLVAAPLVLPPAMLISVSLLLVHLIERFTGGGKDSVGTTT
jgi:uncharacterized protein DUF1353